MQHDDEPSDGKAYDQGSSQPAPHCGLVPFSLFNILSPHLSARLTLVFVRVTADSDEG